MDQHELAEELYDAYRYDYGDGEYAWGKSWDEAGEIIRLRNARQDAWENFDRDHYDAIERDNAIRSLNSQPHRPTRDPAREFMGDVAMSVITVVAVKIIERGINWVIDWLRERFNEVASSPSVSDRIDRLEVDIAEIRKRQGEMQETLNSLSLPKVA